jgi:hypothetical protein
VLFAKQGPAIKKSVDELTLLQAGDQVEVRVTAGASSNRLRVENAGNSRVKKKLRSLHSLKNLKPML